MQGKTLANAVKVLLKCAGVDKRKEESFFYQDVEVKDEEICEEWAHSNTYCRLFSAFLSVSEIFLFITKVIIQVFNAINIIPGLL